MTQDRDPDLDRWIKAQVAKAPPLREEQRERLAAILLGGPYSADTQSDTDDPPTPDQGI